MSSYQDNYFVNDPAGPQPDLYTAEPIPQHITQQRQQALRNQAKKFKQLLQNLEKDFYAYKEYYIISVRWINRWKIYVGYQQSISNLPSNKFIGSGNLPQINQDIVEFNAIDIQFQPPNENLNVTLREGLQAQKDYLIVNKSIWELFELYNRIQIKRYLQQTQDGSKVEVYYRKINAIYLFNEFLKEIQRIDRKSFKKICLQLPNYKPISQLITLVSPKIKSYIKRYYNHHVSFNNQQNVKVWIAQDGMTQSNLVQYFYKACKMNRSFNYKIYFPGLYLNTDIDITLAKVQLSPTTLIAFEILQQNEEWIFYNKQTNIVGKCQNCYSVTKLSVICACKFVIYCSKQCKLKDKYSHSYKCDKTDQQQSEQENEQTENQNSKLGKVGLRNLGNTCFMNSGIQCISSIEPLTKYFLEDRYVSEINTTNKLGTKGQLCQAYAKLIKKMWRGKQSSVSPILLKRSIAKIQPMFSGYEQHDSCQLISYLLDGLHEDLNRVLVKPYTQSKDYDGRPDYLVAKQSWQLFLLRNRSQIVDLMYGQYKSKLDCPKCNYQSIIFDPFLIFNLPVPQNTKKKISIVYLKNHIQAYKYQFEYQKSNDFKMNNLMALIANRLGYTNKKMIAITTSYYSCEFIDGDQDANKIRKQNQHRNILLRLLQQEQNIQTQQKVRIQHSECHSQYGNQNYRRNITFQRMYLFDKNITTKQIHHKLAAYYKQLLKVEDYEKQIINANRQDQKWRILIITNSRYDPCYFCEATNCQNCELPYSDNITLGDLLKKIKPSANRVSQFCFELQIYWRKQSSQVDATFQKKSAQTQSNSMSSYQKKDVSIYDCFNLSEQPQILQQDNAWYCPKCKEFVLAKKQLKIYKAPKILIICFKRFKGKGYKGLFKTKLQTQISFPINDLDLTKYVQNTDLPEDYFNEQKNIQNTEKQNSNELKYELFAISNHYGTLSGGHYTAYCKKDKEGWFQYDDSSVRQIDESNLVGSMSYILFYKRKQL